MQLAGDNDVNAGVVDLYDVDQVQQLVGDVRGL